MFLKNIMPILFPAFLWYHLNVDIYYSFGSFLSLLSVVLLISLGFFYFLKQKKIACILGAVFSILMVLFLCSIYFYPSTFTPKCSNQIEVMQDIRATEFTLLNRSSLTPGNDYLFDFNYINEVHSYVNSIPSRDGLMIWGPKFTGKTRGLQELKKIWSLQGRVVIDLLIPELETKPNFQFIDKLKKSLLEAWSNYSFSRKELHFCFVCTIQRVTDGANDYEDSGLVMRLISYIFGNQLPSTQQTLEHQLKKWRYDFDQLVKFLFENVDGVMKTLDFAGMMRMMECLAIQKQILGPIIIFSEIQKLQRFDGGETILNDILKYVNSRTSISSVIPIIAETSDSLWFGIASFQYFSCFYLTIKYRISKLKKEGWNLHYKQPLNYNLAKIDLVNQFHLTDHEVELLWDATQGNSGSISKILKNRRVYGIAEAIESEKRKVLSEVVDSLCNVNLEITNQICVVMKKNWDWSVNSSMSEIERSLIEMNIFLKNGTHIIPQNNMIQNAIEIYLRSNGLCCE